jgi:hypothetical protein
MLGAAGCGGRHYWNGGGWYDNKPVLQINGTYGSGNNPITDIKGVQITEAAHKEFERCGVADDSKHLSALFEGTTGEIESEGIVTRLPNDFRNPDSPFLSFTVRCTK